MKWYREHMRLTVISVILLILVSLTVASFLNQGSQSWLGQQIERVTVFLQQPVFSAGNSVANTIRGVFQFKKILEENEALKEERARLERDLIKQTLSQQDLADLKSLSEALEYVDPSDYHKYVAATVIAMDGSNWYNIFTINAGKEKGIHKDAIVINGDGLIGRVLDVGSGWSKVISIIDENNDVSFQVFRDLSLVGILTGDGQGKLKGYMLDEQASVIEGDVLITSGMELYPRGIPIGKVSNVTWNKDTLLRTVDVEPAVNFTNIQKVTVIITEPLETE